MSADSYRRWALPGANGRVDALAVFDLEPGLDSARAGRSRLLLRRVATARAPEGARAVRRGDLRPRQAHGEGDIALESAKLQLEVWNSANFACDAFSEVASRSVYLPLRLV
jgi:hypothetical protein